MTLSLQANYRFISRIKCSFPNVEIALRTNLILMVTNCSGKRSFSKLKYIDPIADFDRHKGKHSWSVADTFLDILN